MPTKFTGYSMGNLIFDIKSGLDFKRTRVGINMFVTLSKAKLRNTFDSYNSMMSVAYYKDKE
jgi:hypothetical protein